MTTEVTIDGAMAAMMSGAMPRMVMRVKGTKSRTDVEVMGQSVSTITDLTNRQVIVLTPGQKTAQVFEAAQLEAVAATAPAPPRLDVTFEPTGKTQTIGGQQCEQFTFRALLRALERAGQSSRAHPRPVLWSDRPAFVHNPHGRSRGSRGRAIGLPTAPLVCRGLYPPRAAG